MYGMVNNAICELVNQRFGADVWQRVKARAGVDLEVFISNDGYDDQITYALVAATAEETGLTGQQVLEAFGEHWVLHTGRAGYGHMFAAAGRTLPEFLHNLPSFHARVRLTFPNLRPPRFEISQVSDGELVLHYHTHRPGLAAFTVGLLKGLGRMYNVNLEIRQVQFRDQGSDHDAFHLRWGPAA